MENSGTRRLEGLQVLVTFTLFAVMILGVLLVGAGVLRRVADRDEQAFNRRTALQYVAAKVRNAGGEITVEDFAGMDSTLCITEEMEGERYVTRLYCCGGSLRELFCGAEEEFRPEDGEIIIPVMWMHFTEKPGLLTAVAVAPGGGETSLSLALRTVEAETA